MCHSGLCVPEAVTDKGSFCDTLRRTGSNVEQPQQLQLDSQDGEELHWEGQQKQVERRMLQEQPNVLSLTAKAPAPSVNITVPAVSKANHVCSFLD